MAESGRAALGLVGIGKIARDQHVPAISAGSDFTLTATASPNSAIDGVPAFPDLAAMLAGAPSITAVSLSTPAAVRYDLAVQAIEAGRHVMLEKPPAATLSQASDLADRAREKGVTLFATWHVREGAAVEQARQWLAVRRIDAVRIFWKEDIRHWHPGQEWLLGPGGFGVFDPGINALSVLTAILPHPVVLDTATMEVPEGRVSPLRATLAMRSGKTPVSAEFDFLQTGAQRWDIEVDTDAGPLTLADGGATLTIGDAAAERAPDHEYARLYARFAELIARGESDVDLTPLQLVADAFLVADRTTGERFTF